MKIETKYNIGDEVWIMGKNKAISDSIEIIKTKTVKGRTNIYYSLNYYGEGFLLEHELYKTKQELLESL